MSGTDCKVMDSAANMDGIDSEVHDRFCCHVCMVLTASRNGFYFLVWIDSTARKGLVKLGQIQILLPGSVPRRLFFAAQQRIAITLSPKYYQKMQRSTTRKNQE